jgi:drug/metabolite transporter (DMT)-like permease
MNDQDISVTSVFLNILATLGFIFFARTPPQTSADIVGIAIAAIPVFGTVLAAIAIRREWLRVLSAALIIIAAVAIRTVLQR